MQLLTFDLIWASPPGRQAGTSFETWAAAIVLAKFILAKRRRRQTGFPSSKKNAIMGILYIYNMSDSKRQHSISKM